MIYFTISPGKMKQLRPENIPEEVIAGALVLVLTCYRLRCKLGELMLASTMQA